jgi:4-hydroxy-3-polyprenylbenzoate decarboxylase
MAVLAIRKTYPQQARKVAAAFWGLDYAMCRKLVIVVDEHVEVHDHAAVMQVVAANVHPGRDAFFHQGPAHPLDHATPAPLQGHHMGLDATAKLAGEHPTPWPARLSE